jgi:hypothetical protein
MCPINGSIPARRLWRRSFKSKSVTSSLNFPGFAKPRVVTLEALVLYVQIKKRKSLKDLKGKIQFSDNYDHKKLRVG